MAGDTRSRREGGKRYRKGDCPAQGGGGAGGAHLQREGEQGRPRGDMENGDTEPTPGTSGRASQADTWEKSSRRGTSKGPV